MAATWSISTKSIDHDLSTPVCMRPHYSAQNRLCLGFGFTFLKTLSTSPAEKFNELGYSLETCRNLDNILQMFLSEYWHR